MMKTHTDSPPSALTVFMTELQASKSVVGLIADNPRTNAPFLQIPAKRSDRVPEKAMRRWVAMECQRIDTILSDSPNSPNKAASSSPDDGCVSSPLLVPTNDTPKLPPIEEYFFKAPFKPERRDSPGHAMLHTDAFFPIVPSKDFVEQSSSSPKNPMESNDRRQEFLSRMTVGPSLSSSSRSTPSCCSNCFSPPVCPRRKQSIDSPDEDDEE
ncbi:unnamed protein product [Cylindrotheca closterium]|uniref:Uncharacterized protein n=1 Tax=Cylindrotheca closterium TaxID=2856 RepID=A0AAD2JGP1_9STRA|nr:unnamed protein product [Cylindrotheca closterium]